jgi:predicted ATP-dependent serine protease
VFPGDLPDEMSDRVRTGIVPLDRKLGGGIPVGQTVLFTAPSASQAELILASIATQHDTLYLTTERPVGSVETTLEQGRRRDGDVTVRTLQSDEPLAGLYQQLQQTTLPDVLVVDRIEPLEQRETEQLQTALETLARKAETTGTAIVLHGLTGNEGTTARERTTYMSDIVFDLRTEFDGNTLTNRLFVPKFRGGSALADPLSLELTERIIGDTSRDIA